MNRGSDSFVWGIRWETVDREDDTPIFGDSFPGCMRPSEMRNTNSAASSRNSRRYRIRSAARSLAPFITSSLPGTRRHWARGSSESSPRSQRPPPTVAIVGGGLTYPGVVERDGCHLRDTHKPDLATPAPTPASTLPGAYMTGSPLIAASTAIALMTTASLRAGPPAPGHGCDGPDAPIAAVVDSARHVVVITLGPCRVPALGPMVMHDKMGMAGMAARARQRGRAGPLPLAGRRVDALVRPAALR